MTSGLGHGTTPLPSLPPYTERWSTVYLERSTVGREDNGVVAHCESGTVHIPVSNLCAVLLGPGTTVTHQAVELIADAGCSLLWVGEEGVRFYASGQGLSRTTRLLERQATLVSNRQRRLAVARQMYMMRFQGEDVTDLTMQQLRGREGARIKSFYAREGRRTGVPWRSRDYDRSDWGGSDPINRALSTANAALYGIVHAGIVASGASPGLGFVHTGDRRSFVYDIADLYKTETTIPIAFDVTAEAVADPSREIRTRCREIFRERRLLDRIVRDVRALLGDTPDSDIDVSDELAVNLGILRLWEPDSRDGSVAGGVNYEDRP